MHLDDLFLTAKTPAEHIQLLDQILKKSIQNNFTFKAANCHFFRPNLNYLGHEISTNRAINPKQLKVKAMKQLKTPDTAQALARFISMTQFFKPYIPHYTQIVQPLTKLLKASPQTGHIQLQMQHKKAIDEIKTVLTGDTIVYLPDNTQEFELVTDASKTGLGAVLFQRIKIKGKTQLRVITYASQTLNQTQSRYDVWVLECLAIVSALLSFQQIIQHSVVNIYTDNISLKFLLQSPKSFNRPTQSRIQKWVCIFGNFNANIHYVKGTNNIADALSRDHSKEGDSLITEAQMNKYFDNKINAIGKPDITKTLNKLVRAHKLPTNSLSPPMVIRVLTAPKETYHVELIYETRSSIPNQSSTILANTTSTHTRDRIPTQDIRKLEKNQTKDQDIDTESDKEIIDPDEDNIRLNKRERKALKRARRAHRPKQTKHITEINDVDNEPDLTQKHDMKQLQKEDELCNSIITYMRQGKLPDSVPQAKITLALAQDCRMHQGILYKLKLNDAQRISKPMGYQLVIPKVLIDEVLKQAHLDTAHAALSTFTSFLRDKFFWPNMLKHAATYIKQCTECSKLGSGYTRYQTSYTYTNNCFNHIQIDVAGPFHTSKAGYRYVLTTIDIFSGYVYNAPLISTTAQEICEHLFQQYTTFGFPVKISTDNAQYFVSKQFQTLHSQIGTYRLPIPPYSAWKIGKVERTHTVLANRLAKCIQDDPDTWEKQIKYVTFSMNATRSARTNLSPHEIVFGRPIACPSTNLLDQSTGDMTVTEHVKYTLSCLQHNLRQARLASQVYVGKMTKRTQEQAQSDHKYLLYDQVWVFKPHANLGLPRKLAPKYKGPFMIASVLPNNTYKLSKGLGEPTLKGTVSAQRLKPFYIKTAIPPEPSPEEQALMEGTPTPNLDEVDSPSITLKDSCTEDENVRSRDTDIDLYAPVQHKDKDNKIQNDNIETEESDTEGQDEIESSDDDSLTLNPKQFLTFNMNTGPRANTRRKNKLTQYNRTGELTLQSIRRIFGIIANSKQTRYILQLTNGKITQVTRDNLASEVIPLVHGRKFLSLSPGQIEKIKEEYSDQD